jgi:peptidyl-prolyl cis-trans isomerase C
VPPHAQEQEAKQSLLRIIVREPLVHFVLIGTAIYLLWNCLESRRYVIDVQPEDIQGIVATYQKQFGSTPTPTQLKALIDSYITEEIYVREGTALGLDRNDEIVRRRIAQKYEFLQSDQSVPRQPSDRELEVWFEAHRNAYRLPEKSNFEHLYFAMDSRGEAQARAAAQAALPQLRKSEPVAADAFPAPLISQALTRDEVERLFGNAPIAVAVFTVPLRRWTGPIRSGFGWHDIFVRERIPAQVPAFEAVRDRVRNDMKVAEQEANNRRAHAKLLARYHINRADMPQ